ncbi:MAG: glycosyltransferase [Candidatus Electrothrix gigas]
MHFLNALKAEFSHVTYGDDIPDEPIDLLWTNQQHIWKPSVKRMAYFASVGHYAYVRDQINKAVHLADSRPVEGRYGLEDYWKLWLTLARSSVILVIGNDRIFSSFQKYAASYFAKCILLDCGIDYEHFSHSNVKKKEFQFVYNVTRCSIRKGSHIAFEAWKNASSELPREAKLVVLGRDGDYDLRSRLSDFANVDYVGEYESGSSYYISKLADSKWVISTSLAEGQAGTLLEALSCGCVPLASLDSGINADAYGGHMLAPNTPETLCEILRKIATGQIEVPSGPVHNVIKEKHSWEKFENKVVSVTKELLNTPPVVPCNKWKILARFFLSGQLRTFKLK